MPAVNHNPERSLFLITAFAQKTSPLVVILAMSLFLYNLKDFISRFLDCKAPVPEGFDPRVVSFALASFWCKQQSHLPHSSRERHPVFLILVFWRFSSRLLSTASWDWTGGGVAVVSLWTWSASRGPVPPFSWITGFLLHPTHKSRHPTPLPPRLQLRPSEPEWAAGRRDVWVNKHQMLQWFQGDFLFRILARNTLARLCIKV